MSVDIKNVHPFLRTIATKLPPFLKQYGITMTVTSGYRSTAKQAQLYRDWKAGINPYPANKPGLSKHEKGLALDIVTNDLETLVFILRDNLGLRWAGMRDPVHFEIPT